MGGNRQLQCLVGEALLKSNVTSSLTNDEPIVPLQPTNYLRVSGNSIDAKCLEIKGLRA